MNERMTNALTNDIKVVGRSVPVFLILLIAMSGFGAAALISMYGSASGTADIQQSITLNDQPYDATQSLSFDGNSFGAGTTKIGTHKLTNNGDQAEPVQFQTTCENATGQDNGMKTANTIDWNNECNGINTQYVEYFDDAGANLNGYEEPDTCTYTVSSHSALAEKVDDDGTSDASSGETVCVNADLNNQVTVAEDGVTVASTGGMHTITASAGPVVQVHANGVTFTGFTVENTGSSTGESGQALEVDAEADESSEDGDDNVLVSYIDALGHDKGVVVDFSENITLRHIDAHSKNDEAVTVWDATDVALDHLSVSSDAGSAADNPGELDPGLFIDGAQVMVTAIHATGTESGGIAVNDYSNNVAVSDITVRDSNFRGAEPDVVEKNTGSGVTVDAHNNWFGTDGIQTSGDVAASYKVKDDMTLEGGETDWFGLKNAFAFNLKPDTYRLNMTVAPA